MRSVFKTFNLDVEDIKESDNPVGLIEEAISKFAEWYDRTQLEVVLNENLLTVKDKFTGAEAICGCRVRLDNLEKSISFIVRPRGLYGKRCDIHVEDTTR